MAKKGCTNSDLRDLVIRIDERVQVMDKTLSGLMEDFKILKENIGEDHFKIKALEARSMSYKVITLLRGLFK